MNYLIDTNIFIEAKNGFYAFDICPGFWNWLKSNREIHSINMVKQELLQGEDDLSAWVKQALHEDFFLPETTAIQEKYCEIASYVYSLWDFEQAKRDTFLSGADGWLIAAASCLDSTIITHEHYDEKCRRKILLPNIASHFNVQCVRIEQVLRSSGAKFN